MGPRDGTREHAVLVLDVRVLLRAGARSSDGDHARAVVGAGARRVDADGRAIRDSRFRSRGLRAVGRTFGEERMSARPHFLEALLKSTSQDVVLRNAATGAVIASRVEAAF